MVLFHRMKYLCSSGSFVGAQTVIFERVPNAASVNVYITPGVEGVGIASPTDQFPRRRLLFNGAINALGKDPMIYGAMMLVGISMIPMGSLIGVGRNAKRVIYSESVVSRYKIGRRELWPLVGVWEVGNRIELKLTRAYENGTSPAHVVYRTPVEASFPNSYHAIVVDNVPELRGLKPVLDEYKCDSCHVPATRRPIFRSQVLCENNRADTRFYCSRCRSALPTCRTCWSVLVAGTTRCPICNPRKFQVGGHGWRPGLVFDGEETPENKGLFLGIELETQPSKASYAKSDLVCQRFEEFDPEARNFYLQRDGSIDWVGGYGIEICSHPRTEKGVLAAPWPQLMKTMKELGYRSHNGGMCGMHVHLSRDGLGPTGARSRYVAVGMNYLIEANWQDFVRFSRRAESQLRWCGRSYACGAADRRDIADYFSEERGIMGTSDRYLALNPSNLYTVEIRLFRGTLRYETFLASIELLRTMVMLAKKETQNGLRDMTMDDIVARGKIDLGFSALPQYWESRKGARIPATVSLDQGLDGNPDDGDGYVNEQYEYWPEEDREGDTVDF